MLVEKEVEEPSDCEVCIVIKFLVKENMSGKEIHIRLCALYTDNNVMGLSVVYQWVNKFKKLIRLRKTIKQKWPEKLSKGLNHYTT